MKENNTNVYATNRLGKIQAPKSTPADEPKSSRTVGDDLRVKRSRPVGKANG